MQTRYAKHVDGTGPHEAFNQAVGNIITLPQQQGREQPFGIFRGTVFLLPVIGAALFLSRQQGFVDYGGIGKILQFLVKPLPKTGGIRPVMQNHGSFGIIHTEPHPFLRGRIRIPPVILPPVARPPPQTQPAVHLYRLPAAQRQRRLRDDYMDQPADFAPAALDFRFFRPQGKNRLRFMDPVKPGKRAFRLGNIRLCDNPAPQGGQAALRLTGK
ncbi:MAG: hypothetical protein BWY71_00947 [Planctomycetes bacterium ADurb.Bin412]|nr:MAG: hypothetical protein BWY71_00947 [Planctomycetes bacterium ADurb.Bin412]